MPQPGELVAPAFLNPPPTAYDPRGFAVGVLSHELLADAGLHLGQWRWRYGPDFRANPFPPHKALDGRFVAAEGVLDGFYPDDHKGCLCALSPVWRVADTGRVARNTVLAEIFGREG